MAESGWFKKKSSKSNNLRRRRARDSSESDDGGGGAGHGPNNNGTTVVTSSSAFGKLSDTRPLIKPDPVLSSSSSNLLSFDQDDGEETFRLKKSSHSRRLEKLRRRAREEKADERELSPLVCRSPDTTVSENFARVQIEEADSSTEVPTSGDGSKASGFQSTFRTGAIPDAQMVYMARKQRQKARELGDVIPLDDTQKYKKDSSRLLREDEDNDDESDYEEEGGRFYSRKRVLEEDEEEKRRAQAEFLDIEQGESDNERDEEFERWEREQIRKGVSAQQMATVRQEHLGTDIQNYYAQYGTLGPPDGLSGTKDVREPEPMELEVAPPSPTAEFSWLRKKKPLVRNPKPLPDSVLSLDDLVSNIRTRITDSDDFNRNRSLEKDKLDSHLEENQNTLSELSSVEPVKNGQFERFQEIRAFVHDYLDCMNDKYSEIQALEERVMSLRKNKYEFFAKRRRQDIKDQFDECSMASSLQAVERSAEEMMRISEREARRGRRRQAREVLVQRQPHHDGDSSDDEEAPSRIASFQADLGAAEKGVESVFADTLDDFCNVSGLCRRFAEWLLADPTSFEDAFVSLCLPRLVEPLVRLELLSWSPLEDSRCLKACRWYKEMLNFADFKQNLEPNEEAVVAALIPEIVEKVIVPKLAEVVENCWDPTSSSETSRLSAFFSDLLATYPTISDSSKSLKTLLGVIYNKAKESLENDLFTPIYSKEVLTTPGAKAFLDRQFWFALKLLRNLRQLEGFVSTPVVQELVLDGVLNRHLVLGLQCSNHADPLTLLKCKAVVDALPTSWIGSRSESMKELEPLCKVLCRLSEAADAAAQSGSRELIKDVYKMLVKLTGRNTADCYYERIGLRA